MPKQEENREDSSTSSSQIGQLIAARIHSQTAVADQARKLADDSKQNSERIARSFKVLDEELLQGKIDAERASKRLNELNRESREVAETLMQSSRLVADSERQLDIISDLQISRLMEKGKLEYDCHKHFTTLGTATLLFIATFTKVIFPDIADTASLALLIAAFALLVYSVTTAALAMKGHIGSTIAGETSDLTKRVSSTSFLCFTNGVLSFVFYLQINLLEVSVGQIVTMILVIVLVASALLSDTFSELRARVSRPFEDKEDKSN